MAATQHLRLAFGLLIVLSAPQLLQVRLFGQEEDRVFLPTPFYQRGAQPGQVLVTAELSPGTRKALSQFQVTSVELVTDSARFLPVGFTTPMNYQRLRVDQERFLPLVFSLGNVPNGAKGHIEVKGSFYEGTAFRHFALTSESKDLPWNGREGTLKIQGYYFDQETPNIRRKGSTEFERIQILTGENILGESSLSGAFSTVLPPGQYEIRGHGGLWSSKIDNIVTITSGITTSLDLDMNAEGPEDFSGIILESPDTIQDILDISFTRFRLGFTDLGTAVIPTGELKVRISGEDSNTFFADVSALFSVTPAGDIEATNIAALKTLISAQTGLLNIYVDVGSLSSTYYFSIGRTAVSGTLAAEGLAKGISVSNRLVVAHLMEAGITLTTLTDQDGKLVFPVKVPLDVVRLRATVLDNGHHYFATAAGRTDSNLNFLIRLLAPTDLKNGILPFELQP